MQLAHTMTHFFIKLSGQLLIEIPILLKHISIATMSLNIICTIPIPVDTDTYLQNSNQYI